MGQPKCLNDKNWYLYLVFSVWSHYFPNRQEFDSFFESISSDKEKELFLRIGLSYMCLVKKGKFTFRDPDLNKGMGYVDDSYKYIAIFFLIEALCAQEKHLDFYHYLMKNKFSFNQGNASLLDEAYKQYKQDFGAQQLVLKFFNSLDEKDKIFIQRGLKVNGTEIAIEKLVQLLYQMRSMFVHQAQFILGFDEQIVIGSEGDNVVTNLLSIDDMQVIFENGFLKRFGYR